MLGGRFTFQRSGFFAAAAAIILAAFLTIGYGPAAIALPELHAAGLTALRHLSH